MALSLNELLEAQAALKKKDEEAAGKPASISLADLKQLAGAGAAPKGASTENASLVRIYQELRKHTGILIEMSKSGAKATKLKNTREDENETRRILDHQTDLLEEIAKNTVPKKDKEKEKEVKDSGIGGWMMALAAAVGAAIAAFKAQIKAIQLFAKALLPEALLNALRKKTASFIAGLSMQYDLAKMTVTKYFDMAMDFVKNIVSKVKNFFSGEGTIMSTIQKIFGYVKNVFTTLAEPFENLFKYIKKVAALTGIFDPIIDTVKGVMKWASTFGRWVSKFAVIFEKLFLPLTIILTIWDTVKGAIEGWEKGGLVGAISGALSGLVNSLVGGLLDLVKSMVSWVLGAFGFDKAEKFLDSFSFQDLIKEFFDALFAPLKLMQDLILRPMDTIKRIGENIGKFIENIGIPEISFTVPIIDKKISFGPYYPFKKEGQQGAATVSGGKEGEKRDVPAAQTGQPVSAKTGGFVPNDADKKNIQSWVSAVKGGSQKIENVPPVYQPAVREALGSTQPQLSTGQSSVTPKQESKAPATSVQQWTEIAGEKVMPGQPLSAKQAAVVEMSMKSGNSYSSDVMNSYNLYKAQAGATPQAGATQPQAGQTIYQQSAQNAAAAQTPVVQQAPTVVSAPTTNVNNTTNSITRLPSRNNDPTLREFYNRRYAF